MTLSTNQAIRDALNPKPTLTNADAIRQGLLPCETNPRNGCLSQLAEIYHATAKVTVGSQKANRRHVCDDCHYRFHRDQKSKTGIHWD